MALAAVMNHIKERLTKVDPNNRKVVAIFQIKAGDANWGEWLICIRVSCLLNENIVFSVIDLKDLKVYEGTSENVDATLVGSEETILLLIKKELSLADAISQVNLCYQTERRCYKSFFPFQGKVEILGNAELVTKAFEARG